MAKADKEKKKIIRALFDAVALKEVNLEKGKKAVYETSGMFRQNNGTRTIDIKVENNISELVGIVRFLLQETHFHEAANKACGVNSEYKHQGATPEDWIADCNTRIAILNEKQLRQEIATDKAKLLRMDPTILAEIELEDLQAKHGAVAAPAEEKK